MEILKIIIAVLIYAVFASIAIGIFCYCIAFINAEEVDPEDETFLK